MAFRRSRRLAFVYSEEHAQLGSTIMRGQQLAEMVRESGLRRTVDYVPIGARVHDADLFLTKGATHAISARQYRELKARRNRILIDPVDEAIPAIALEYADVIVAASRQAELTFSREHPTWRVVRIDHHVDPRVRAAGQVNPGSAFRVGYFGALFNAFRTDAIDSLVDFHVVTGVPGGDAEWFLHPREYCLHYGVRVWQDRDSHKPFLKGFTAATVGAPILVGSDDLEAAYWLGDDYPFAVVGELNEISVLEALQRSRESFGGEEWHHALEVSAEVAHRVRDAAIVESVRRALDDD